MQSVEVEGGTFEKRFRGLEDGSTYNVEVVGVATIEGKERVSPPGRASGSTSKFWLVLDAFLRKLSNLFGFEISLSNH